MDGSVLYLSLAAALALTLCFFIYRENNTLREDYRKLLSQKKKSEVVTGQIAEKLAPFTDHFPYNPQDAQFLGNPIDYVVFEKEKISIVEIKSGRSRLTKKQRDIKTLIEKGKVEFVEIRIK